MVVGRITASNGDQVKLFVDEPIDSANGRGSLRDAATTGVMPAAFPLWRRLALLPWLALPALAACSDASGPGAPVSLHDVPPMPQLSDSLESRALAERALAAEGAQVQREAAALRARTSGKTALPPPPEPKLALEPPPVPGRPAAAALVPPNVEAAIAVDRVRTESDDASLNAFLRQLVRRQPDRPATRVIAAAAEGEDAVTALAAPAHGADAAASGRPPRRIRQPMQPLLDNVLRELGIEPLPAPTAAAEPQGTPPAPVGSDAAPSSGAAVIAAGSSRLSVDFAGEGAAMTDADADGIAQLAGDARARGEHVLVIGHGASHDLALARARAVAQLLIRHGLPAQALSLHSGGEGQSVELLAGAVAS